jgi:hypothetical protein
MAGAVHSIRSGRWTKRLNSEVLAAVQTAQAWPRLGSNWPHLLAPDTELGAGMTEIMT